MINIQDKSKCCGCNACVQRCPKQCISMHEDNEGFLYPKVDERLCVGCGLCEKVCPVINQGEKREPIVVYAAKNPNEEIRLQSSSGGIFTMLAEQTIDKGGVVFGVGFNKEWEVEHQYTETKEGLAAFRGSKYVQSRVGNTFREAEEFLKQGREVLYSGTPCQIAALRNFLNKEYDNLLTVDVICHGAPSPGVFRAYLEEEKERYAQRGEAKNSVSSVSIRPISERDSLTASGGKVSVEAISFRDKEKGWEKFSFVLLLSKASAAGEKNTVLSSYTLHEHPFLKGFLADLYLRPSCHACPAKELKSGSDITLGDYWGIASTMPELDDDKGVSAVLINTPKGVAAMNNISAELHTASYEDVRQKNPAIYRSCLIPSRRVAFFKESTESFTAKVLRLSKKPLRVRIKQNAYRLTRGVLHKMGLLETAKKLRRK